MPSLDLNFLKSLYDDYTKYTTFIETGTCYGSTTFAMEPYFDHIYTIEIKEEFMNNSKSRYNGNKINFLLGDSSVIFSTLLPKITDRSIFFLDGHYSSCGTGRGVKDCPLIEEIKYINTLFKNDAIIIIDDYRLFGKGPKIGGCNEDWEDITKDEILNILKDRTIDVYHLPSDLAVDDRLVIHIKQIE